MIAQYTIVLLIVAGAVWVVGRKLVAPFLKSGGGSCGCGSGAACGSAPKSTSSVGASGAGSSDEGDLPRAAFGSDEWLAEVARLEAQRNANGHATPPAAS